MKVLLYDDSALIYGIAGTGASVVPTYGTPVIEAEFHTVQRWKRTIEKWEALQEELAGLLKEARKVGPQ